MNQANARLNGEWGQHVKGWRKRWTSRLRRAAWITVARREGWR